MSWPRQKLGLVLGLVACIGTDYLSASTSEGQQLDSCNTPIGFVHVNKAGGTSMLQTLRAHVRERMLQSHEHGPTGKENCPDGSCPPSTTTRGPRSRGIHWFHASAYRQQQFVSPSAWDRTFTFALVRNPWARQVSMFYYLLTEGMCSRSSEACVKRLFPQAGDWVKHDAARGVEEFRSWMARLNATYPPGHKKEYLVGSMGHGNEKDSWFNASQISWLIDSRGKFLVNVVIRLEDLDHVWDRLRQELCAPDMEILRRNPSQHAHYSLYFDSGTKAILDAYMQADIRHFGYKFERTGSDGG